MGRKKTKRRSRDGRLDPSGASQASKFRGPGRERPSLPAAPSGEVVARVPPPDHSSRAAGGGSSRGSSRCGGGGWDPGALRAINQPAPFGGDRQKYLFVSAMYTHRSTSEVLLWLVDANKYGQARLRELAETSLDRDHPEGAAAGAHCLGRVVAPLLDWISTVDDSSTLTYAVNQVAAVVVTVPRFLTRLCVAVDAVLGDPALAAAAVEPPCDGGIGVYPTHWAGILAPVATFCSLVLERFPHTQLAPTDWDALFGLATAVVSVTEAVGASDRGEAATVALRPPTVAAFPLKTHERALRLAVTPLARLLAVKRRQDERAAEKRERADADRRRRQIYPDLPSSRGGARTAAANRWDAHLPVGPGGHPGGPRHDNDHDEFRDISVAPTAAEMLCSDPPYLPLPEAPPVAGGGGGTYDESAVPAASGGNPGRLIDRVYRLTREDCLAPLRDAIQGFLAAAVAAGGYPLDATPPVGKGARACLDSFAYRNAQVGAVSVCHGARVGVTITFKQPRGAARDSKSAARWWADNPLRLGVGTLACLARDVASANPILVFGVIVERDVDPSQRTPRKQDKLVDAPSIALSPCGAGLGEWLGKIAAPAGSAAASSELLLLHTPTAPFFAVAPVLKALANLEVHLPFPSILASPPGGAAPPAPPGYLLNMPPSVQALDLNVLVEDPERRSSVLGAVNVMAGDEAWPAAELRDRTSLDESQLIALRAALSTSVCLVQGPPGTGKSYLSIRVVQLLSQRLDRLRLHESKQAMVTGARRTGQSRLSHPGGILVVSYTNHALDQFLLGLLKRGFSDDGKVVRLGRASEHPALESISLMTLKRRPGYHRPGYWSHAGWRVMNDLEELQARLKEAVARVEAVRHARQTLERGGVPPWSLLDEYLAGEYPGMHRSLTVRSVASEQPAPMDMATPSEGLALSLLGKKPKREQEERPSGSGDKWQRVVRVRSNRGLYVSWVRGEDQRLPEKGPPLGGPPQRPADAPDGDEALETLSHRADAWEFSVRTRLRLLGFWLRKIEEAIPATISTASANVEAATAALRNQRNEEDLWVLRKASIVGATTSKAAEQQALIAAWAPRVVVIEEAGEVSEAHSLAVLHGRVEQLLLIGDHKQLRPKVNVHELSVDGGLGYNMDVSLFERLAEGSRYANVHLIRTQRRMRGSISELVRDTVYPSLVDAPCVEEYPENVAGMGAPLYWWDHGELEDSKCRGGGLDNGVESSHANKAEVLRVRALVEYLVRQGYDASKLVVLTGYAGQLRLLEKSLSALAVEVQDDRDQEEAGDMGAWGKCGKAADGKAAGSAAIADRERSHRAFVRLATVDNFQGEESDVVIVSMVRCNNRGSVGFLASSNRINVLLSRARHGLYIIGSRSTLTRRGNLPGVIMLTRVTELLEQRKAIGPSLPLRCEQHGKESAVTSARDFAVKAGDGGCTAPCRFKLNCGHVCPRRCHPDDRKHTRGLALCREPCMRIRPASECTASHPCRRPCGEACGPCRVKLPSVVLSCGHTRKKVLCGEAAAGLLRCAASVAVMAPLCGHATTVKCSVARENKHLTSVDYCAEACGEVLPCGHHCDAPCRSCRSLGEAKNDEVGPVTVAHVKCTRPCNAVGACGHKCGRPCHDGQPCPPCGSPCERGCVHADCPRTCGEPCVPCMERCVWACPHLRSSPSPGEAPVPALLAAGPASALVPAMVRCAMPCGAPCDRLPCDRRCELRLACGHRCPSVCGEVCPPPSLCAECGESWRKLSSTVVDLITLTTLGETDLDVDPVLVMPCGHVFPRSTLDGWMELTDAYSRSPMDDAWMEPLPLPTASSALKGCPLCRRLAPGIRRYGRPHIKARLDAAVDDHIRHTRGELNTLVNRLESAREAVTTAVDAHVKTAAKEKSHREGTGLAGTSAEKKGLCTRCALNRAVRKVAGIAEAAKELACKAQQENPASRVYAAALAVVRRGEQAAASAAAASAAAASSATDAVDASDAAGAANAAGEAASKEAEQRRLQAIALPPPDLSVACMAWMLAADAKDVVAAGAEAGADIADTHEETTGRQTQGTRSRAFCYHPQRSAVARRDSAVKALLSAEVHLEEAEEVAALGHLPARATEVLQRRTRLYERRVEVEFVIVDAHPSLSEAAKAAVAGQEDLLRRLDGIVGDLRASLATYPSISGTAWVTAAVSRHEALRRRVRCDGVLSVAEKRSIFEALHMSLIDVEGHMYRCPAGHAYFVDDCGATNQIGRCPECGATIGGTYAGPAAGNQRDRTYAERPSHYTQS